MSKISELVGNSQQHTVQVEKTRSNKEVFLSKDEFFKEQKDKDVLSIDNILGKADNIMKNVDHPSHYQTSSGIEVIDVIEAFDLGFNLGNVCKYILRAGHKDLDIQDLEKAKWYLEREIANRKANR